MSGGKKAPIHSKQPIDLDTRTIAKYRALEERYVAELPQVRLVIRRGPATPHLASGESPAAPVVELMR